ncbi:MAG TPA: lipid II flippase MurJ [Terriglobia bacterium]|nr:lipid II flippase MurJ [Terriglobia bacterium]
MSAKRQMVRSSMVVGVFSSLGSLTGILVEISIAANLGLSKASDTFYVAFTVPYIITNLISATGQFSLVPFFSSLEAQHPEEEVWRGFSYVANIVFLGLGALAVLGALTAPWLVRGIAPGFTADQAQLATRLARWLFIIIVPAGVAEIVRSFLFSRHRFAIPASANFFRNATVVLSVLLGFRRYHYYSIIFGYLAGYLVQFAVLGGQLLIAFPARYSVSFRGSGEAFRNLHGAGLAQMATALSWQGVVIVERIIASFLPPGTITALAYGIKIMSTIAEVFAGSAGTAALPRLSRAVARQAVAEVRSALRDTLEISLAMVAPFMVFCLMLDRNIIRLVFERGRFTPEAASLMTMVFFYYCLSLLPYAAMRLMNFYLFARNEASSFFRLAVFQYALNIVFDLFYVGILHLGPKGIPLGMLTAVVFACGLAWRRDLGRLRDVFDPPLGRFALKVGLGSGLATLAIWGLRLGMAAPKTGLGNFVYLCIACGAGSAVYLLALMASGTWSLSQLRWLWQRPTGA